MSKRFIGHGTYGTVKFVSDTKKSVVKIVNKLADDYESGSFMESSTIHEICFLLQFYKKEIIDGIPYPLFSLHHSRHPNKVKIYMKYGGISLHKFIKQLSVEERIKIIPSVIGQVISYMHHLEKMNMFHGDLSLSNILIHTTSDDNLHSLTTSLIDWGTVCFAPKYRYHNTCTISYTSPELCNGHTSYKKCKVSSKSDVFSIGMVIKHMVYGYSEEHKNRINPFNKIIDSDDANVGTYPIDQDAINRVQDILGIEFVNIWKSMLKTSIDERVSVNEMYSNPFFESYIIKDFSKIFNTYSDKDYKNINWIRHYNAARHRDLGTYREIYIDYMYMIVCTVKRELKHIHTLAVWLFDKYIHFMEFELEVIQVVSISCIVIADLLLNDESDSLEQWVALLNNQPIINDDIKYNSECLMDVILDIVKEMNGHIFQPMFDHTLSIVNYDVLCFLLLDENNITLSSSELRLLYDQAIQDKDEFLKFSVKKYDTYTETELFIVQKCKSDQ